MEIDELEMSDRNVDVVILQDSCIVSDGARFGSWNYFDWLFAGSRGEFEYKYVSGGRCHFPGGGVSVVTSPLPYESGF